MSAHALWSVGGAALRGLTAGPGRACDENTTYAPASARRQQTRCSAGLAEHIRPEEGCSTAGSCPALIYALL